MIEKLGAFYLGKEYDLEAGEILDRPVMYDARDLTTHAVCVGMTGSGKTGLCIDLLEEAALDSVPAIIIDPKGDVTNLLLTFPELQPKDFLPWINVDDARRKGQSVEEYAQTIASVWRKGLADWGEGPERIRRLKESAEFLVYTPGSDAGLPVSILHSLAAPPLDWEEHEEMLREIASLTGGRYFRATSEDMLATIYARIGELEKTKIEVKHFTTYEEMAPRLMLMALVLLLFELLAGATISRGLP